MDLSRLSLGPAASWTHREGRSTPGQQEEEGWGSKFKVGGGRGQEHVRPQRQLKFHISPPTNSRVSQGEGSWVPTPYQAGIPKNAHRLREGSKLPVTS